MQSFFNKAALAVVVSLNFVAETIVLAIFAVALACAVVGVLNVNAAPIEHTTINRAQIEEQQESDPEGYLLAAARFANALSHYTGWSDLSKSEKAVRIKTAGLILEEVGKTIPKNPIGGGFFHSFFRQMGVQMQVQAAAHLNEIPKNPIQAALYGFWIGL